MEGRIQAEWDAYAKGALRDEFETLNEQNFQRLQQPNYGFSIAQCKAIFTERSAKPPAHPLTLTLADAATIFRKIIGRSAATYTAAMHYDARVPTGMVERIKAAQKELQRKPRRHKLRFDPGADDWVTSLNDPALRDPFSRG